MAAPDAGEAARTAYDVFCHRLRKDLGGADALVLRGRG